MSRFIDPTTDFGFKKIFGDETNKDIIMGFITDALELVTPLLDINFREITIERYFILENY
jgi:hypothetical protein